MQESKVSDSFEHGSVPLTIGLVADLFGAGSAGSAAAKSLRFVSLELSNFDEVLNVFCPTVDVRIDDVDSGIGTLRQRLSFTKLCDFDGYRLIKQFPELSRLLTLRDNLYNLVGILSPALAAFLVSYLREHSAIFSVYDSAEPLLEDLARCLLKTEQCQEQTQTIGIWLKDLVRDISRGSIGLEADLIDQLRARIQALDELLDHYLNEVHNDKEFKRLNATWHGLHRLVTVGAEAITIKVLSLTKAELWLKLTDDDAGRSTMFHKIVENEFCTFGGEPFGLLLADYTFSRDRSDINLLEKLARVCAASCSVLVAGIDSSMFGVPGYSDLSDEDRLASFCATGLFDQWRSFTTGEGAAFTFLTFPLFCSTRNLPRETASAVVKPSDISYVSGVCILASRIVSAIAEEHIGSLRDRQVAVGEHGDPRSLAGDAVACDERTETQLSAIDWRRFGIFPCWFPIQEITNAAAFNVGSGELQLHQNGPTAPSGPWRLIDLLQAAKAAQALGAILRRKAYSYIGATVVLQDAARWLTASSGDGYFRAGWKSVELVLSPPDSTRSQCPILTIYCTSEGSGRIALQLEWGSAPKVSGDSFYNAKRVRAKCDLLSLSTDT